MGFLSWFITTNKGKKEVSVPTSWPGVTLKQYVALVNEWDQSDLLQLFSILSGQPVAVLNNTYDPALEESLILSTRFVFEDSRKFLESPLPKTVTVAGKTLAVPKKGLSIGQSIRVREALDSTVEKGEDGKTYYNYDKVMAIALAHYLQPVYDESEYDDDRAAELVPLFENVPVTEVYSLAFFLLKPLMNPGASTGLRLLHQIMQWLKASSKRELQ